MACPKCPANLPPDGGTCPECGSAWTLRTEDQIRQHVRETVSHPGRRVSRCIIAVIVSLLTGVLIGLAF